MGPKLRSSTEQRWQTAEEEMLAEARASSAVFDLSAAAAVPM